MRFAILILFVAVQGDLVINNERLIPLDDLNEILNTNIANISGQYDAYGIYHPPVFDRESQSTFWRNYGIRFVIGAAVSTIICLIIVVIRLCKQSKQETDTRRLFNPKHDLV